MKSSTQTFTPKNLGAIHDTEVICYNFPMTETKWLTVKQASQYCYEMGLPRSTKSIRRWCQYDNVDAQKRKVANTEKWFIDQRSLAIKIKEELEFLKQSDRPGQQADMTGYDQTRPDVSGHERTQADMSGHGAGQRPDVSTEENASSLREEIASLKIEVRFNERMTEQFKKQYLKSQEALIAQSRYIGHIETQIYQLGESPDQAFLKSPVPKSDPSEDHDKRAQTINSAIVQNDQPHPDQNNLYTG